MVVVLGETNLLLADCAVLESSVAQYVLVGARVAAQAGFAGFVEQVEDDNGGDPENDAEASSDDAVGVT